MTFTFFFFGSIAIFIFFYICDIFTSYKYLLSYVVVLGVSFGIVHFLTENNVGAEPLEHEDGISIRQDSSTVGRKSLFIFYGTRSHMGGGLAGGK